MMRDAQFDRGSKKTGMNMYCNPNVRALRWVLAVLHVPMCQAQAQQYVLDTIGDGFMQGITWSNVVSTSDGGTSLHLMTFGPEGFLWKMDEAGEPDWCKLYGISSKRRARMPDGGLAFCEITGSTSDGDTSNIRLQVVRTDEQGEVVWSKLLTIHDSYVSLFNNQWLCIASNVEGDCLITMGEVQSSAYQWFYCLDADGELLWSRNFLFNPNADHVQHICSDGLGGWFFGSYVWSSSVFRLGHLNVFGDVTWYNSYSVTGPEFWLGDICSMGSQVIAVGGYDAVPEDDEYRWFVIRLTLNGTLDWLRISATTQQLLSRCSAGSAGELLVSCGIAGYPANYLARLSSTGEVISSIQPIPHLVDGTSYATWFVDWDYMDTTLTMGNFLLTSLDSLSPPSYQPAVWRLPITDLSACGTAPYELSSEILPNSTVILQDQPYSTVAVPVTITDTVCSVTSFTPLTVSDYCYYFTGVPPVAPLSIPGSVATTLVVQGDPIRVTAPAVRCGVTVHDAHGRTLYRERLAPNSNERIPTSTWVPGLYFVRFQPEDGGKPNVVKVLIE